MRLIFFLLFASAAQAMEPQVLRLDGKRVVLLLDQRFDAYVAGCGEAAVRECEAGRVLRKVSMRMAAEHSTFGGRNPGAVLCEDTGGESCSGVDKFRNQVGLCRFKDGSIALADALRQAALVNDRAEKR